MEAATPDPRDGEKASPCDSPGYWFKWLQAAKRARETHIADARAAWAEYKNTGERDASGRANGVRAYPIYYASSKVLEPALYALTPDIIARRRFGWRDDMARTAAKFVESLGESLVEGFDFDATMMATVQDFLHADKATTQLIYKSRLEEIEERVPLQQGATPEEYLDPDGGPWSEQVMADQATGALYGTRKNKVARDQEIFVAPISYDKILHTPEARIYSDITDIAYWFTMPREEAESRFPPDALKDIQWQTKRKDGTAEVETPGEFLEGWEIWCSCTGMVYWVTEANRTAFLDKKPDPYGLEGFFPSPPFAISNKPDDSLFPTPAYIHLHPILQQMHEMYRRIFKLITAVRRRVLLDGSVQGVDEIEEALSRLDEAEFITVSNLQGVLEKGGLDKVVMYVEVQDLVNAITELVQLSETFNQLFYEWFGIPDILRGASDPIETAKAQEIKQGSAQDRFKYAKKQIATLARDSIRMMVDLALRVLDDQEIFARCGVQYWEQGDQQRAPQALAMLRNDEQRAIRLDIDTSSLTFYDRQARQQEHTQIVSTITAGMKEISGMLQQGGQEFALFGMKLLLGALEGLPGGGEYIDDVKETVQGMIQQVQNAPPPPPPEPDHSVEVANIKAGVDRERIASEQQIAQLEHDAKIQELSAKVEVQSAELVLQARQQQIDAQFAAIDATIKQLQAQVATMDEVKKTSGESKSQTPTIIIGGTHRQPMTKDISFARDPISGELSGAIVKEAHAGDVQNVAGIPSTEHKPGLPSVSPPSVMS